MVVQILTEAGKQPVVRKAFVAAVTAIAAPIVTEVTIRVARRAGDQFEELFWPKKKSEVTVTPTMPGYVKF